MNKDRILEEINNKIEECKEEYLSHCNSKYAIIFILKEDYIGLKAGDIFFSHAETLEDAENTNNPNILNLKTKGLIYGRIENENKNYYKLLQNKNYN